MLRRIHRLVVRDIRKWTNEHVFEFGDGVTLVKGPNGAGKSTLAMALTLTMCHSANSNILRDTLKPRRGGAPLSSVTFSADAGTYTITKVWGDRNASKLVDDETGEVVAEGEEAEDTVSRLAFGIHEPNRNFTRANGLVGSLNNRISGNLAALFFHSQGTLSDVLDMGEALRNIGLQVDEQELAKAFRSVSQGANDQARLHVSSWNNNNQPAANARGTLVDVVKEAESVSDQLETAREHERTLVQLQARLINLQTTISSDEDRVRIQQEIEELHTKASEHQALRDEASRAFIHQQETYTPIKTAFDERNQLESLLATSQEDVVQKREVMNTNSALREQAIGVRNELLERRNLTGHERTVIMQWLQFNNHEANILMASKRLEELNAKLELRTTTIKDKEGHQSELEGLNAPTPEQWRELRELSEKQTALSMQQNITVEFNGDLPEGVELHADGEKIEANGTAAIHLDLMCQGDLIARIAPNLNLDETLDDIHANINALLVELGAENISELNVRQRRETELQQLITQADGTLAAIATLEELQEQIAQVNAQLAGHPAQPSVEQPEGDLTELMVSIDARLAELDDQLGSAEEAVAKANEASATATAFHQSAQENFTAATTKLNNHQLEHGPSNELHEREQTGRGTMEAAKEVHEGLINAQPLEEDARRTRATNLANHLSASDEQRTELVRLEERVEIMRQDALLIALPELEATLHELETKKQALETDYTAYRFIMETADEAREQAQAQSRSQITTRLDTLLRHVWGHEPQTTMSEDGTPNTVGGLDFADESYGTREQYNVMLRMVLLGLLRMDEATGNPLPTLAPMMLDDALVFADEGRLKRMKDALQSNVGSDGSGLQLIVFSCRGSDYVDIANQTIDLDATSA